MTSNKFILGIDLGTTSVKVALIDSATKTVSKTKSRETHAYIHDDVQTSCKNEQDPDKILTALQFCVSGLAKEELRKVIKIGISGQMHGIVLWKHGQGWSLNINGRFERGQVCSHLYTWQDGRCTSEFISTLPKPNSHLKLASGIGCATIFWLMKNEKEFLCGFDRAGTIQDYVVAMLCGLDRPVMSVHNAASWGYFDTVDKAWNTDILKQHDFPSDLLPQVVDPGSVVGRLEHTWYDIQAGTPVSAAMGDLQCSFLSRLPATQDAVLNISTSAQLSFQMNPTFIPPKLDKPTTIEYFPYFKDQYLAVAASLTGGNVMYGFVNLLQQWTHELGLGVSESKIWEKVTELGMEVKEETDLKITPTIYGERHDPSSRGTVSHITPLNTSLGSVYNALSKGVIANLHEMMSQEVLLNAGVKRIVGSGTSLIKNGILQKEVERLYELPLVLENGADADSAVGAAIAMLEHHHDEHSESASLPS